MIREIKEEYQKINTQIDEISQQKLKSSVFFFVL